jgi:acyl carrier protein
MEPMTSGATPALIERVRSLLAEVVGPERAALIDADTDIVDDAMLDSVLMISFLLRVEDALDIEIEFEDLGLDQVRTLRTFTGFLVAGHDGPV